MSKFNTVVKSGPTTVNRAGGEAYELGNEAKLVSLLLSSFLTDQFYRSGEDTLAELKELVATTDPLFCAKAAVYARDVFGMRSVSHVVAAELCRYVKGEPWLRRFFSKVIVRPDDVTEILAYWLSNYGKPVPNAMKRGLGDVLTSLDAYRLGKYKADTKKLSLVDAVNICHPQHTEQLSALMRGTLESPETWEVLLTKAGQTAETPEDKAAAKADVWMKLLSEKKLGYFALLRNLRNIIEQAPQALPLACEQLVDEKAIRKSRVLPFRFLSAWDSVAALSRDVALALSEATDIAVGNIPELGGKTLVAVDTSGSMTGGGWGFGGARQAPQSPIAIASLFAAALYKKNDSSVLCFDTQSSWAKMNPANPVMTNALWLKENARGGGTNFHLIFDNLQAVYDRVIILSDMQAWVTRSGGYYGSESSPKQAHKDYCKRTGADPLVYCFDLQGYSTAQFPAAKVTQLSGWSDKAFDYIKLSEKGYSSMVAAVKEITF